jgi:DNA-binding NtrC family response regulator
VHRLVTDHGGAIDVESGAGAGARFRVVLPLAAAGDLAAPAAGAPAAELAREALDVLVAEPDAEAADFLARYLRTRGHAVIVAHDATQAARLATADAFDVVIASARLADADDGFVHSVRGARERGARPRCVLVAEASRPREEDGEMSARAGACAVLERPFQIEQLRHAVEDA